jgi:hypothetical protein
MALVARAGPTEARYEDAYLPERPIILHAARPVDFSPRTPILFVHHGDLRNGAEFRDFWLPLVDRFDVLAVVPEFSKTKFPGSSWYSLGNRSDADGGNKPREQWTYGVPARIFTALSDCGVTTRTAYGQFGHSSGAQFVHRSICLGFREAVTAAVTANAGTYSMPDLNVGFPYGLGGIDIDDCALRDLLGFPLAIFAGTADIDVTSPHFPQDEPAMRQGRHALRGPTPIWPRRAKRLPNMVCIVPGASPRCPVSDTRETRCQQPPLRILLQPFIARLRAEDGMVAS